MMNWIFSVCGLLTICCGGFADSSIRGIQTSKVPRNLIKIKGPIYVEASSLQSVSAPVESPELSLSSPSPHNPYEQRIVPSFYGEKEDEIFMPSSLSAQRTLGGQRDEENQVGNLRFS